MQQYLARRFLVSLVVLLGVSIVAFTAILFIPSDVVEVALGVRANESTVAAMRHRLGLDLPPLTRYMNWLLGVIQGDLGKSLRTDLPVLSTIKQRLPVTLELAFLSTFVSIVIGIPAGIVAALRRYSMPDKIATVVALVGLSTPDFWLGTLLLLFFSITIKLLPPGGILPSLLDDPVLNLKRMLMPSLALGFPSAAVYFRITRSSMLEVIGSDYIRTAYSKGLAETRVILIHALKNALIPVLTMTSLEFSYLLGGSFIIETIYSLPGLGRATVDSIFQRDYITLQGCLLIYAVMVVFISIGLDVVYAWIDPRIQYN